MKTTNANLATWTLSLVLAGACAAQAQTVSTYYVDDRLDLVDQELEEKAKGARDVELLAEGLEPLFLEPVAAEPDDLGRFEVPVSAKMLKASPGRAPLDPRLAAGHAEASRPRCGRGAPCPQSAQSPESTGRAGRK